MEETGGETVPTNVLGMLTRLRQLALHPGLVPSRYVDELRNRDMSVARGPRPAIKLKPQDKFKLQAVLAKLIEDCEECPICFGTLSDPRITSCSHAFCLAWYVLQLQYDVSDVDTGVQYHGSHTEGPEVPHGMMQMILNVHPH